MKNIISISIPRSRIGQRVKQANGTKFSRRIVFPASIPKFGNHVLLISEDFIKTDPDKSDNCILNFYEDSKVHLSKKEILANGEVVYPSVTVTPKELRDSIVRTIPQKQVEQKYNAEYINTLKNNISALEYLKDTYGFTFKQAGHNYFKCDQHDSLIVDMRKNAIYWNSQQVKGTLIDFINKIEKKPIGKCIEDLDKYYKELPDDRRTLKLPEFEKVEFRLPERANSVERVQKYLCIERGLDEIIVNKLIQENRIYQDIRGNSVFVMRDAAGKDVGAFLRSTYSGFRGDVAASNKACGFFMEACPTAKKLVITESFIDALSYVTLKHLNNETIDFNVLGCDSATMLNETFRINYLTRPELNQNIDTVILAPDNDQAGLNAIESFKEFVKPFHYITEVSIDLSESKDWNNDLTNIKTQEMDFQI